MPSYINQLPVLGLGFGYIGRKDLALFSGVIKENLVDYAEPYAGCLSIDSEELFTQVPLNLDIVMHAERLSMASGEPVDRKRIMKHRQLGEKLNIHWTFEDIATWHLDGCGPVGEPFWPPVLDEEALDLLIFRATSFSHAIGRPVLAEFPPLRIAFGTMSPPEFFRKLVDRTNIGIVLDISHWQLYCESVGLNPKEAFLTFPMENVIELHIAGGRIIDGYYSEEHSGELLPETIELLAYACELTPSLRAVTVECHGATRQIIESSIRKVAALPQVIALRSRRTGKKAVGIELNEVQILAASEELEKPGPPLLQQRERLIRDLLQYPQILDGIFEGEYTSISIEDMILIRRHSSKAWFKASRGFLRQFPKDRLSVRAQVAILNGGYEDFGDFMQAIMRARPISAGAPSPEELLHLATNLPQLQEWARDVLAFERDVVRLRKGMNPLEPYEKLRKDLWRVTYRRSITKTLQAIIDRNELPVAEKEDIWFCFNGEKLSVLNKQPSEKS